MSEENDLIKYECPNCKNVFIRDMYVVSDQTILCGKCGVLYIPKFFIKNLEKNHSITNLGDILEGEKDV